MSKMKNWLRGLYIEGREGFVIMGLVAGALFAAWLLGSIVSVVLEGDPATRARCKSLQGEYGGGKCFKDGKEV